MSEQTPADGASGSNRGAVGCGVVLLALAALYGLGSLLGGGDDDGGAGTRYGAISVCHDRVKDGLKAPSTAKFSEDTAVETSDGVWEVRGAVDAENSFGAALRSSYTCIARHTGGDSWKVRVTRLE